MSEYQVLNAAGQTFIQYFGADDLKTLAKEFYAMPDYDVLAGYYAACAKDQQWTEQMAPLLLLKDSLDSLIGQRSERISPALADLSARLDNYTNRLVETVRMLTPGATEVPKIMHFVWVGGSAVGAIQRDYINIWKDVMVKEGHTFNLWYDSDALLAFEMNRVILESARVHAMESGGATIATPAQLAGMIEHRARVLKVQMAAHLRQERWVGKADEARIDLMVRAYGKDEGTLIAFRQKCLDSHLAMVDEHLRLRDVREVFKEHLLWDAYQREVAGRGNFAAASDVVRLQVEALEGGRYSDVDYLPQLKNRLGGVDITSFGESARIGVLQLLLNHNESLMPGRDPGRYPDRTMIIPEPHRKALTEFALQRPGVNDIFSAPVNSETPMDGIRMAIQNSTEMNSHIVAHPGAGSIQAIIELIRFNYDFLATFESRLNRAGADWSDSTVVQDVLVAMVNEKAAEVPALSHTRREYLRKLASAIRAYYSDGIRYESRGTIELTGPGAAVAGLEEYVEKHLLFDGFREVRERLKLADGYNVNTEEEKVSGWTINATPEEWLQKEQANWADGKLKTRYQGNFSELLKGQTLSFEKGWPIIEGRPVLLTGTLQRLMDELGEPFIRAMNEKLSGELNFDKSISLDFDERQRILNQPLTELPVSLGFDPIGNLNEMIVRIGHGALPLDHLSPVHRVVLGGLFGAPMLDNAGFATAWQQLGTLAKSTSDRGLSERYMAIEQVLLTHKSPEFEAAFAAVKASFEPSRESAQVLKILSFDKPLSLRQWGERVARIRHQTEYELRTYILQRSASVRKTLLEAGASMARLMPQGLLVRGDGDPGRRCYPLALLMAAATHQGREAVQALSGRLANAHFSPSESDSHAFLQALDDLRAIPQADFGDKLGALSLDGVFEALAAKPAPCTLMLNTENHSMMVARTGTAEHSSWSFYDPNFGVFGFDRIDNLKLGMQTLFSTSDLARQYAIESTNRLPFNVIELDGNRLASKRLPSKLQVSTLLGNESLSSGKSIAPWSHHAQLRSRALSENARLGRGLSERDASVWATKMDQVTKRVRAANGLGSEYVPVFATLQAQPDDGYTLSFMDVKTQRIREVTTKERFLKQIKSFLDKSIEYLAGPGDGHKPVDPTDVSEGSRLSFAFGFQALITELRNRDHNAQPGTESNLAIAVRLHGYLGYAQLAHGIALDTLQMANVVRQLVNAERAIAVRTASAGGRLLARVAGPGLGQVLGVVNIGFDIYELYNAENHEQKARFGTQLLFDVSAVVLDGVALVVGGTAGAVAGFLSVPLLGVGIGVTAIAGNLGQIMDKAEKVAELFTRFKTAYGPQAFSVKEGVVSIMPEAVVDTLDLRQGFIEFGSQGLFRSLGGSGLPRPDGKKQNAIIVRESMGLPKQVDIPGPRVHGRFNAVPADSALLLPGTPTCYYGYEYQLGADPEVFQWSDLLLSGIGSSALLPRKSYPQYDVLRDLEAREEGFYFTHARPFPHILYKLNPVYEPTTIDVRVGNETRALYVPELPREMRGKVSYRIDTMRGAYSLALKPGLVAVHLSARPGDEPVSWVLIADWITPQQVSVGDAGLNIDGIELSIDTATDVYVRTKNLETYRVDRTHRQLSLASLQAADGRYSQAELDRLKKLHRQQRIANALIPAGKFLLPFGNPENPQYTVGWYEVAKERFVYGRQFLGVASDKLQLAAVQDDHAYFYHPDQSLIWRVNAITGLTTWRYNVVNFGGNETRIIGCLDRGAGVVQVTQRVHLSKSQRYLVVYLIHGLEITLVSVSSEPPDYFDMLKNVVALFQQFDIPAVAAAGGSEAQASWKPASFVTVTSGDLAKPSLPRWINGQSQQVLTPHLPVSETASAQPQLSLLPLNDPDATAFLFHDALSQHLYHQPYSSNEAQRVPIPGSVMLRISDGGYLVVNESGLMFDVRQDASFVLNGVTEEWLDAHPKWMSDLETLGEAYAVSLISLSGLSDISGRLPVFARYLSNKLLIADIAAEKGCRLLSVTRDGKHAWLLGLSTGHLYRQAFIEPAQLSRAFGSGRRLINADALPRAEKVWGSWTFSEVLPYGTGLRGRTRDGVNLELIEGEPARIVSVENAWSYRPMESTEALTERLKNLVSGRAHAPYLPIGVWTNRYAYYVPELDRVFDVSGRADGQWANFLGTKGGNVPLLFDPVDGLIFNRNSKEVLWVAANKASREGDVMTLEVAGEVQDLLALVPDGVSTVILGGAVTGSIYHVSDAVWQHFDCIVVDCTDWPDVDAMSTQLILSTGVQDDWRVDRADTHLLLTDRDNGSSLVFRSAHSEDGALTESLKLSVQVLGGTLDVGVHELWQTLFYHGETSLDLKVLVEKLNSV
ncbi:MAG: TcdA/TcdB pore-forming domain-containing protein [Pseudomonas sp.]